MEKAERYIPNCIDMQCGYERVTLKFNSHPQNKIDYSDYIER
jgi:hypothetical protein